jgi:hypothetical protein
MSQFCHENERIFGCAMPIFLKIRLPSQTENGGKLWAETKF